MINHYRTLGVDPSAEAVVIRSAYLALMNRYHPDKNGAEADPARAQAVTAAWEVLRDPERRAAYDEARRTRFQPDGPGGAAVFGAAPRVRGGTAARNLFLLLAAGTLGLGWWALGVPQEPRPQAGVTARVAARTPVPAEPSIRPTSDELARAQAEPEPEPLPHLPDVPSEPDVDVAVVLPPLPANEPARMPVRAAEAQVPAQARNQAARRTARAEQVQPAPSPPPRPRAETSRTATGSAAPAATTASRVDLAPLERHLQLLTDQSLKHGTEAKRTRLFATRETFIKRLRDCSSDACKRDAYLRRNAEVGEIMRN